MAKKNGLVKAVVGLGAAAVAGKVAYDKYKATKEAYIKEENESVAEEVRKYNAICEKKVVEIEDEVFTGCELKAVGAKTVLDLGLAVFEKDVYINFTSTASTLTIILPEGVNATCDVERTLSGVRNLVENVDEEGIHTAYILGKATCSNIEVIPVNFYVDEDGDFEDTEDDFVDEEADGQNTETEEHAAPQETAAASEADTASAQTETVRETTQEAKEQETTDKKDDELDIEVLEL